MNKFFTFFGFLCLICFSFIMTDKTTSILLNNDELMMKIKEVSSNYSSLSYDGVIENNTFIPGISGKEVNIKKSYNAMKKYGIFMSSLLEYNEIKPKNELKDNYNKYIISGNDKKKEISLIFIINEEDDIDKIISILDDKGIKANFFVDGYWFEKNNDMIPEIIKQNHIIGNLSYNSNYNDGAYIWMDTIIKRIGKQNIGYCYVEDENEEILKICSMNKNYTIKPGLILKNNYIANIKKDIKNGMIISLDVNNTLINELPIIISYIESKGYKIDNLNELLKENT